MREAVRNIWKYKLSYFLIFLQMVCVIVYFFMTTSTIQEAFQKNVAIPKVLGKDMKNIIYLQVQNEETDTEKFYKMCAELKKEHAVQAIGAYQNSFFDGDCFDGQEVGNLQMTFSMDKIKRVGLISGRYFEKKDMQRKKKPVIVGNELAEKYDVKPGNTIWDPIVEQKYEVIGVMKKGELWFQQSIGDGLILSLDNQVMTLLPEKEVFQYYCCYAEQKNKEEIIRSIEEAARRYDITIEVKTMEEELRQSFHMTLNENISWLVFSIVIMVLFAIGMATLSVSHMIARKKEIGIRMAVGYPRKKICRIFVREIFTVSISAYVMACVLAVFLIGNGTNEWDGAVTYNGMFFSGQQVLLGFLAVILLCIPSVLTVYINGRRLNPVNLLGRRE